MCDATSNLMTCRACGIESEAAAKCPVCGAKVWASPAMDALTVKYTAFDTFAEFADAMEQGYVPTIYATGRGAKEKNQFAAAVRAAGFRVYDGQRVA